MPNRHAAMFLAYNQVKEQHDLTVEALESLLAQDIGQMDVLLIDNGSTYKGTWEHFEMIRAMYLGDGDEYVHHVHAVRNKENASPVKMVNRALNYLWKQGHEKVFAIPNDVIVPSNAYRLMNEWPRGLVCASATEERDFPRVEATEAVNECTPAAVAVIRKWFHDALVAKDGYYLDEEFFHYASDMDFAIRMRACGLCGIQLSLPYFHQCSSSWRMLPHADGKKITDQADLDRVYFEKKWGFGVSSEEYSSAPSLQFRGIPVSQKATAASGDSK